MKYQLEISGKQYELLVKNQSSDLQLFFQGRPVQFDYEKIHDAGLYSLILNGRQYRVWIDQEASNSYRVILNNRSLSVSLQDERRMLRNAVSNEEQTNSGVTLVRAPIPGLIIDIEVETDQSVRAGDGLVIMEAMKMENEIKAPGAGKIGRIHVKQGDAIDKDSPLLEITNAEGQGRG
ncbi:MAG: acetyl-CoA carboxylase biotin carboxyl carrier protein subunit [bacterium]